MQGIIQTNLFSVDQYIDHELYKSVNDYHSDFIYAPRIRLKVELWIYIFSSGYYWTSYPPPFFYFFFFYFGWCDRYFDSFYLEAVLYI